MNWLLSDFPMDVCSITAIISAFLKAKMTRCVLSRMHNLNNATHGSVWVLFTFCHFKLFTGICSSQWQIKNSNFSGAKCVRNWNLQMLTVTNIQIQCILIISMYTDIHTESNTHTWFFFTKIGLRIVMINN